MHKQTLKNLLCYYRDTTFEQFCREIFPDFNNKESRGYLSGKFGQFQNRFIRFLAELDEAHLEYFSDAVLKHYGSDDPEFCDIADAARKIIGDSKNQNLSQDQRNIIELKAQALLVDELLPFEMKLDAEYREMELAVVRFLLEQINPISKGEF